MRLPLTALACFALLIASPLRAANSLQPATPAVGVSPVALDPAGIVNIPLSMGVITTLKLQTEKKVDRILLGQQIVAVQHETALNRIDLTPTVQSGTTNMVVTIEGVDYVFVLEITHRLANVAFTRTFTLGESEQRNNDLLRLRNAPVLKPSEIDVVGTTRVIEAARLDPVFRRTLVDYRQRPLSKDRVYHWNNSLVYLVEANAFLDRDLIVFKVQWVNTHGMGVRLLARQLKLRSANTTFTPNVSYQDSEDGWVLPGQMDTLWLFVQGRKLGFDNNFDLVLPPDAETARKMLQAQR